MNYYEDELHELKDELNYYEDRSNHMNDNFRAMHIQRIEFRFAVINFLIEINEILKEK